MKPFLTCEDSFKYQFELLGKVHYIFTSPPFFNEHNLTPLGQDKRSYFLGLCHFMDALHKTVRAKITIFHVARNGFCRIRGEKMDFFDFPISGLAHEPQSAWRHIPESDIYAMLSRFIGPIKPGQKLLDPFCGTGTILKVAEIRGLSCYGLDKSESELVLASQRLNVNFLKHPVLDAACL